MREAYVVTVTFDSAFVAKAKATGNTYLVFDLGIYEDGWMFSVSANGSTTGNVNNRYTSLKIALDGWDGTVTMSKYLRTDWGWSSEAHYQQYPACYYNLCFNDAYTTNE